MYKYITKYEIFNKTTINNKEKIKLHKQIKKTKKNITNIKILHSYNEDLMLQYRIICNKIINCIINVNDLQYLKFRDTLYDIFIYKLII